MTKYSWRKKAKEIIAEKLKEENTKLKTALVIEKAWTDVNIKKDMLTARRCLEHCMRNKYDGCRNENCLNTKCALNKRWK